MLAVKLNDRIAAKDGIMVVVELWNLRYFHTILWAAAAA